MAKLTVLWGEPQSGRTAVLYDALEQHMARGEHAVLLVPGQATYRAERDLVNRCGGLLGVDVYSLERLSERLIDQYGRTLPFLNDRGRAMVLRRAALRAEGRLGLFSRAAKRQGFAAAMDARIGRFKQSCITPDDLVFASEKLPEGDLLRQKLHDFALLYRESEAFLSSKYLTANDLLTVAETLVPDSWLRDCDVYVDEFDPPREQAYRLLLRILTVSKSVTITLRHSEDPALAQLYEPDQKLYDRLFSFCAEKGIPLTVRTFIRSARRDPALLHLDNYLFSQKHVPYPDATDAITVLTAQDRMQEVELVADHVLALVKGGRKWSDIVLVTGELDAYAPLVRRAFARRNIPLFYDASRPIGSLAAATFIRSAARAACLQFPIDDILSLLKTGYAGASGADAEIFENYVLRYGIYGSECQKPFAFGEIPPEAEAVRAAIMETLLPLHAAMSAPKTTDRVRALWNFCEAHDLGGQLRRESEALLAAGENAQAQVIAEVWRAVTELFVQLDTVLGDTETARREFPALIDEGFAGCAVGVLPGQGDAVTLGDILRTRLAPTDTLFVLGCTDGAFLPVRTDDDLINDAELKTLRSLGLPMWEETRDASASDRLALHSLLAKIKTRIIFSYSFSDGSSELSRAALLGSILDLFPACDRAESFALDAEIPQSRRTAFTKMSELLLIRRQEGREFGLLPALLAYFSADPAYRDAAEAIARGDAANVSPAPFGKKLAAELYGASPLMSASRLEQFARCPFAQYAEHGLGAKERKTAEETVADSGTFLHDALDAFLKELTRRGIDPAKTTEADVDDILDGVFAGLKETHNEGILSRDPVLRETAFLRMRTVRRAALSILRQLSAGTFRVKATELSFGMKDSDFDAVRLDLPDGGSIRLRGKIDRLDQTEDGLQFRIIDYKMGKSRRFDPTKLLSGESLQLPLYVTAATALGGRLSGMYYMPLTLDAPEPGETPLHQLFGLTASEEESIAAAGDFAGRSDLIHDLRRTKTGEITGSAASRKRLEEIVESARRIAAKQAAGILAGRAEVYPTESACTWCKYGSVCRFDRQNGCKTRYVRKVEADDLLSGKEELP